MDKLTELLAGIDWTPCAGCTGHGKTSPGSGFDCYACHGWRYPGVRALVVRLTAREALDAASPPLNVEQILIDGLRAKLTAAQEERDEAYSFLNSMADKDFSGSSEYLRVTHDKEADVFVGKRGRVISQGETFFEAIVAAVSAEMMMLKAARAASEADVRRLREALEPQGERMTWRVGGKVPLNVYEGDKPMFQCHTPEDATRVAVLLNDAFLLDGLQELLFNDGGIEAARWTVKTHGPQVTIWTDYEKAKSVYFTGENIREALRAALKERDAEAHG